MTALTRRFGGNVRRRFAGVRVRLTAVATILLALALALAAGIMLLVLHQSLLNSADAATSARATEIGATIATESASGLDATTLVPSKDLDVIQLIDAAGRVVASTPGDHAVPLASPVAAGVRTTIDGATIGSDPAEYRTAVLGVATPTGVVTVVAAAAEGPINDVVTTVAILFGSVFPVILLLLAANTYYFSGRTLRSVERIRTHVAAITSTDLSKRVPEPASGDEIALLATTMNEMLARLQDAREQQLRFVGDASHELRSPLMTIVGLLDLSRTTRESIDPDTVDAILLPEARRLQAMVDDLLLLAKADEHGIPLRLEPVDLDDIIGDEAARLQQLRTVAVSTHIEAIRVHADRDKLVRAVRNIADNASRHASSTVWLSMSEDLVAGTGTIVIADDGSGIPERDRTRVLDRFVRLDTDRQRAHGGSGLGLAIVSEIVRAHGGTLGIGQTTGGGATVSITLPLGDG